MQKIYSNEMRYALAILAFLTVASSPTSFQVSIINLSGSQSNDGIVLKWSTTTETGVARFVIEKKSQVDGEFTEVGTVAPKGAGSDYQFFDRYVYKTTSSTLFQYRIRADAIDGSQPFYSPQLSVTYTYSASLSGVAKRTWGSIKAMFR